MRDLHRIMDFSVSMTSPSPLGGILEIETTDKTIKFELTQDMAFVICIALERFLTQEKLQ